MATMMLLRLLHQPPVVGWWWCLLLNSLLRPPAACCLLLLSCCSTEPIRVVCAALPPPSTTARSFDLQRVRAPRTATSLRARCRSSACAAHEGQGDRQGPLLRAGRFVGVVVSSYRGPSAINLFPWQLFSVRATASEKNAEAATIAILSALVAGDLASATIDATAGGSDGDVRLSVLVVHASGSAAAATGSDSSPRPQPACAGR
jgi:hypothetical protein